MPIISYHITNTTGIIRFGQDSRNHYISS